MKNKVNKYDKLFMILMIASIVIISGTITYAFYQSGIKGVMSGSIAKWSFTANNQTDSFNLDLGAGYPGKEAIYNLELSAKNSDLDVYYEVFATFLSGNDILSTLFWDENYSKRLGRCTGGYYSGIYGIYGVIPKGSIKIINLYYNFPYEEKAAFIDRDHYTIQIKAQQKTGYNGQIPMKLFGTTYTYESIDETFGYIKGKC